jgi:hypothetical protein
MFQIKEKYTSKTFVLGAVTVLSFTIFIAKPAYSTSFSLKFLNDSGQQVGSGGFSYEDNKIRCVAQTSNPTACNPPGGSPPNKEIFVSNALNSFSATISGVNFRQTSIAWWADPSRNQQAGYQYRPRFVRSFDIDIRYDRWGFTAGDWISPIDIRYGRWGFTAGDWISPHVISITIDPTSDTLSGTGTWSAYTAYSGDLLGSGTFIATNTAIAVPEPLTLLGGMTALGFGVAFKRKIRT